MLRWLLFMMIPLLSFAEINGKIILTSRYDKVNVGEFVKAELTIWPLDRKELYWVESLNNNYFLDDNIYIQEVTHYNFSPNNHDALVIQADAVLLTKLKTGVVIPTTLNGETIPVETQVDFELYDSPETQQKTFQVLSYPFIKQMSEFEKRLLLGFVALGILGFIFILFYSLRLRKRIKQVERERTKIKEYIKMAQSRDDFETLRQLKNKVLTLTNISEYQVNQTLKKIEEVQYKRSWSDQEHKEIQESFEELERQL